MDVTEDVAATLRAGMGSHQPLVAQPGEEVACPLAIGSFHVNQRDEVIDLGGISGALMATRNMQMQTFVAELPASGVLCLNDQGGSQMHLTEDKAGTLRAQEHGHQPLVLASQQGHAGIGEGICPTITSAAGTSGNNQPVLLETQDAAGVRNGVPCTAGEAADRWPRNAGRYGSQDGGRVDGRNLIRRLTPLECERLQGFPDGWTDIPGASDSARYKALGNSVAVPCVDFVLRGIAHFLQEQEGRG